ncbi:unnamed protein product [Orchesella dallaii]|uniref:Protein kinase domain-containing protein n=1 Tax=Orchesella dallaii TaxID=48710 RepID=A0ABP1R0C0_9HEXA
MVINNCDPEEFPTLETTSCDSRGILKLNQNLIINKCVLDELYRVDKGAPFATGLYAQVRRCKSLRPSGSQKSQPYYAAKFSPRKRPGHSQNEDCVESLHEIALLCQLKNPYIISFKDAFILDDFIVTIMEFAPGGDLQSVIDADLVLLEKDATRYVYQLLEALKYLHSRHIAHLDIKPQNLLLMGEFPSCDIKLCDFEISRVIRPGMEIREILGTPDYVAPEILLYEPLSTVCDMWSVGILTYVLLTGFSPFGGDTDQETFSNIINEPIDFPEELFEDVSPEAIDFIEKLAVKNGRTRPNAEQIELHEWVQTYVSPSTIPVPPPMPPPPVVKEPVTATISAPPGSPIIGCGPKKRSPRKASAMSGSSTASVSPAGRRQSARSILRACKSAYDLNKMGGKTKSREVLIEKMRIATGEPSGGPWKLRKNLSKSREQLWESKIQLSKSCEKINNNLPGSSRWASVANFPSLDMNTMKSSTSQESVISVMSTCTNVGNAQQQLDVGDWQQQQALDDTFPYSVSMPSTPPVPNFDLSHNNGYHESSPPIISNNFSSLQSKMLSEEFAGYVSLASSNGSGDCQYMNMTQSQATSAAIEEAQRSVAELINTFGGRVSKKLDLKNKFEPILEVDGSEEQPMSLGDCSDNNSTSGVSSIIPSSTCPNSKDMKMNDNNGKQFDSNALYGSNNKLQSLSVNKTDTGQPGEPGSANSSRRNSKTAQQIHDEMKTERRANRSEYHNATSTRRGSMSPPKHSDGTALKGILKKPKQPDLSTTNRSASEFPGSSTARRGSIPSNAFRLYEQHTISSSAKAPKRSILKNGSTTVMSDAKLSKSTGGNHSGKSGSSERSSSRSPENTAAMKNTQSPKDKEDSPVEGKNENVSSAPPSNNNNNNNNNNNQNSTSLNRPNRPTSILITSNADNKIETLESPRRSKPPPDFTSIVITPEKVCEKEGKVETPLTPKAKHSPKKRSEHQNLESTRYQQPIPNNEQSEVASTSGSTDDSEPAAVAIKVFPPDPIIIPKSSILLLNSGKAPDSPVAEEMTPPSPAELKEFLRKNPNATPKQISRGMKSQWGVVCTGSVERAKGRFESVRSKLRRGSVPDF